MTRLLQLTVAALALLIPACAGDGHFSVLGYSSRPNYDTSIRTICVPICKNYSSYTVTPMQGLEMDLHRAIVDEIQLRTPYRVVQNNPDTELSVAIRAVHRNTLNFTPFNTPREAELILTAELIWRDLRTGAILSRPARRPGQPLDPDLPQPILGEQRLVPPAGPPIADLPARPGQEGMVVRPDEEPIIDPRFRRAVVPVVIRGAGHFRPELGESTTTALQTAIRKVAVQITRAMETGW